MKIFCILYASFCLFPFYKSYINFNTKSLKLYQHWARYTNSKIKEGEQKYFRQCHGIKWTIVNKLQKIRLETGNSVLPCLYFSDNSAQWELRYATSTVKIIHCALAHTSGHPSVHNSYSYIYIYIYIHYIQQKVLVIFYSTTK